MSIPPAKDQRWTDFIEGKINVNIDFFPLKLLLARQRLELQMSPGEETMKKCISEIRELFVKNKNHPVARKDLKKIFGRRGLFRRRLHR